MIDQPRASRLQEKSRVRKPTWFDNILPPGSLQRKLTLWIGIPVILLLILILIMDNLVMPAITRHSDEFTLPDFTNMTVDEAKAELAQLDLRFEITSQQYSPGKPAGVILNQFPIAGTNVKSERNIRFVVSLGKKMVTIPNLAGKSVRQAMLDLEAQGLELGEIAWAFSDTIPERIVVFSYPAAGNQVALGEQVNLMVNRGRASNFTYMPDLVGLTMPVAINKLKEKSLAVGVVSHRVDENYLPETVLEQSEPQGAELDVGTEIDLVVSSTE